jgi:hypothetical protein
MINPRSRWIQGLVVWYGLFQAGHLIFNGSYLVRPGTPPFPPPPGGWSTQLVGFLNGIAAADFVNAAFALIFVYGYFRRTRWGFWLGTVTLTISVYAAVVFTIGTVAIGAWSHHLLQYVVLFYVPFLPVVVLFALLPIWNRNTSGNDAQSLGAEEENETRS